MAMVECPLVDGTIRSAVRDSSWKSKGWLAQKGYN